MQTECPHCHTVFSIREADLNQADGQVRCGHCLAIFAAENPYANNQELNLNQLKESDPSVERPAVADVIPPELRAESRQRKSRFGLLGTMILMTAILVSLAALILQYAYYNRESLVKIPQLRPWMEQACQLANCTLPAPKDHSKVVLSSKNIFTHPNTQNALMVSATITNQAKFAQSFPIIELRFENVRGETIAGRRFQPAEYLAIPDNQITQMQPNTPISFSLEIEDPGNDMVSYEFEFL